MFSEIVHLQNLAIMPIASVPDCYDDDGSPAVGSASSKWPGKFPLFNSCASSELSFLSDTTEGPLNDSLEYTHSRRHQELRKRRQERLLVCLAINNGFAYFVPSR